MVLVSVVDSYANAINTENEVEDEANCQAQMPEGGREVVRRWEFPHLWVGFSINVISCLPVLSSPARLVLPGKGVQLYSH